MAEDKVAVFKSAIQCSVKNVFETMFSKNVAGFQEVKPADIKKDPTTIVGIIGLNGDYAGSIGVVVNKNLGRDLVKIMLGVEEPSDSDISDVVGELANMIAGNVKCNLEAKMPKLSITCPTVLLGDCNFPTTSSQVVTIIECKSDQDFFVVLVSAKKS